MFIITEYTEEEEGPITIIMVVTTSFSKFHQQSQIVPKEVKGKILEEYQGNWPGNV